MTIHETPFFRRDLRRLVKKYPSLIAQIRQLRTDLSENPQMGQSIGMSCYKIRIPIQSKGAGKRGGARIITYVQLINDSLHLLTIYDKSEQTNITDKDILNIIKEIDDV